MQVKGIIREFLVNCSIKSYSKRTIKSYRNNLTRFYDQINEPELENITALMIKQQIAELQSRGLKTTYINSIIKSLRSFYVYIVEQEYLPSSPMKKVPWCKERIPIIKAFSDTEVMGMLTAYSEKGFLELRNKTIMAMLFDTGIRCFELCSLTNSAICDDHFTLTGKGNKDRIAAVSVPLHRLMVKYERTRDKYFSDKIIHADTYFLSRSGRALTNAAVERIVRQAGERAKIDDSIRCSPHTCRHYFAQAQIRNGCDIYTLSKLLGHSNIKITQVYLNSMKDKDIIEKAMSTSPLLNLR